MIASARVRDNLASRDERSALKFIQEHSNFGKLEMVTSRESWREQERTRNAEALEELRASRDKTPVVSQDHRLLGFNSGDLGQYGFIASPLITDIVDETMYTDLQSKGLQERRCSPLDVRVVQRLRPLCHYRSRLFRPMFSNRGGLSADPYCEANRAACGRWSGFPESG